jgi:hypothetical protein
MSNELIAKRPVSKGATHFLSRNRSRFNVQLRMLDSLARYFGPLGFNPSMSFATLPEVRSIFEQAQREFKSCTAIPLLCAGGAGNGRVKFRCRRIAAGAE